jgi:hypothetical protein
MPSTVRLGPKELLTAIRRRDDPKAWIETYRSLDGGETWKLDTVPAPDLGTGNPAGMILLRDGRVCLTYGRRAAPYSIRARLSADGGRTWGEEVGRTGRSSPFTTSGRRGPARSASSPPRSGTPGPPPEDSAMGEIYFY